MVRFSSAAQRRDEVRRVGAVSVHRRACDAAMAGRAASGQSAARSQLPHQIRLPLPEHAVLQSPVLFRMGDGYRCSSCFVQLHTDAHRLFVLADAISNATGFGFNGYNADGEAKWDLVSNVEPLGFEVSSSALWLLRDYH